MFKYILKHFYYNLNRYHIFDLFARFVKGKTIKNNKIFSSTQNLKMIY